MGIAQITVFLISIPDSFKSLRVTAAAAPEKLGNFLFHIVAHTERAAVFKLVLHFSHRFIVATRQLKQHSFKIA